MKKIITFILIAIMCCSLCACGEVEKNDAGFLANLSSALEARWKLADKGADSSSEAYKDEIIGFINIELEKLGSLSEYTFEDPQLADFAEQYFAALNAQLEGIQYYDENDSLYNEIFNEAGYNKRAKVIYLLSKNYGLDIDSKYDAILSEFLILGEVICATDDILAQELIFESTGNTHDIVLENTTKYDLSGIILGFKLLDDDGVIVGTQEAYVTSWPAGSKYRASVYTMDKSFTDAEMNLYLPADNFVSRYVPLQCVNNMIIEILAPELPEKLSYGYGHEIHTSVLIDSFSYRDTFWNNGTASVELTFSGTKTYDYKGDNSTSFVSPTYKLYDEANAVVASGSIYISDLRVNESFKAATAYISDLAPGVYRLVLEDNIT